ncbi:transposase [Arthrobacter sp. MMS24-S77]
MGLPRTAVAVDHFHLISLANQAVTARRQNLSQQVEGRRERSRNRSGRCCAPAPWRTPRRRRANSRNWSRQPHNPETNRLYRTACQWWKEIEVLIITGATTVILLRSAVRTAA